jgi:enoyl-CoA hydratase/carnithine racemase
MAQSQTETSPAPIRMNRPERMNAMGGGLREALEDAWFEFRDDPALKVMIITGVGDRAFCAGADLRENDKKARELGAQSAQALLDAQRAANIAPSFTANNFHLYKPVIAAINGWCLAGGCEMALGCDLRIIERHAKMGLPEVKRGMGAKATTHKLHFLTRLPSGLEIVWTGDPVTADRALELGMVNEVVPTGQSVERAREIAREICRRPMRYVQYHKERFFQSLGMPLAYALATEQRFPPHQGEDYRRGLQASLASTLPGWSGT